jgi:hypothetical protein
MVKHISSIFADELLASDTDISFLEFTRCNPRYGLSRHTKLERDVSLDSAKKI